ncbi:MAG TPA: hypothetical protein VFF76_06510 [Holophagaceae bacterium]|jgi:hypothetical protein|nr:hypothetical protein [Holophagaceae bacterium]
MPLPLKRRAAVLTAAGAVLILAGVGLAIKLRRDVRSALAAPVKRAAALSFLPIADPALKVERWGGGEVMAVALTPDALLTAGGFGVRDERGDASASLPTLRAPALTLWRGEPVAGLAAGGLFLRRGGHWEELRSGFGPLHVRALVETPGGELLIGASEGLFKAAWGANRIEHLDTAAVQSIAVGPSGLIFVGGETGLRRIEGAHVTALPSPDPWIQWVGVEGSDLLVITPLGLARGPLDRGLLPVTGGSDVESAAVLEGKLYAVGGDRFLSFDASGRTSETFLPVKPKRVMTVAGVLFVDTDNGLYRRAAGRWELARSRPASLPPGSSHVGALAMLDSKLVVGLFDRGLVVGDPAAPDWNWRVMQGGAAWGVNALLPAGGSLFVASLRGVARFDGQRLTPAGGDSAGAAFSLAATPGGVAMGYGQGVALPDARFLSAFHGLPGNQALALAQDDGGLLFVGTPTGLGAIRGSRVAWRVVSGDGKLPNPWVNALASYNGALYIGTYGGGITKRETPPGDRAALGSFEPFVETEGLKISAGCLVAAGGTLLAGTDGRGLFRLSADGQRFIPLKAPLPSPHITAILPGEAGLFIGTDEGLARIPFPLPGEGD